MVPETFTDDIAPALPSSLIGPLQVVDSGNPNSWIKIDPAGAEIAAAGDARPVRRVIAPFTRVYATASASTIGLGMASHYVSSIAVGGFYATPLPIPPDMDLAEPSSVKVFVAPITTSGQSAPVVRYVLTFTYGKTGEVVTDDSVTYDWTAPDNWAADDARSVLIDNGSGRTFEAGTFDTGDELGLRIARISTATEDTFDKSVKLAERLVFEYTAKQI